MRSANFSRLRGNFLIEALIGAAIVSATAIGIVTSLAASRIETQTITRVANTANRVYTAVQAFRERNNGRFPTADEIGGLPEGYRIVAPDNMNVYLELPVSVSSQQAALFVSPVSGNQMYLGIQCLPITVTSVSPRVLANDGRGDTLLFRGSNVGSGNVTFVIIGGIQLVAGADYTIVRSTETELEIAVNKPLPFGNNFVWVDLQNSCREAARAPQSVLVLAVPPAGNAGAFNAAKIKFDETRRIWTAIPWQLNKPNESFSGGPASVQPTYVPSLRRDVQFVRAAWWEPWQGGSTSNWSPTALANATSATANAIVNDIKPEGQGTYRPWERGPLPRINMFGHENLIFAGTDPAHQMHGGASVPSGFVNPTSSLPSADKTCGHLVDVLPPPPPVNGTKFLVWDEVSNQEREIEWTYLGDHPNPTIELAANTRYCDHATSTYPSSSDWLYVADYFHNVYLLKMPGAIVQMKLGDNLNSMPTEIRGRFKMVVEPKDGNGNSLGRRYEIMERDFIYERTITFPPAVSIPAVEPSNPPEQVPDPMPSVWNINVDFWDRWRARVKGATRVMGWKEMGKPIPCAPHYIGSPIVHRDLDPEKEYTLDFYDPARGCYENVSKHVIAFNDRLGTVAYDIIGANGGGYIHWYAAPCNLPEGPKGTYPATLSQWWPQTVGKFPGFNAVGYDNWGYGPSVWSYIVFLCSGEYPLYNYFNGMQRKGGPPQDVAPGFYEGRPSPALKGIWMVVTSRFDVGNCWKCGITFELWNYPPPPGKYSDVRFFFVPS
ncbi:MAG: hypothetical protein KatS3mg082_1388 [Nitrospiraceae bacterium]|nr:MAG: hypothetical protein KatS3mg082_1388 [Nitrospiraceae bacterium]